MFVCAQCQAETVDPVGWSVVRLTVTEIDKGITTEDTDLLCPRCAREARRAIEEGTYERQGECDRDAQASR